jgi:hypothetical protein
LLLFLIYKQILLYVSLIYDIFTYYSSSAVGYASDDRPRQGYSNGNDYSNYNRGPSSGYNNNSRFSSFTKRDGEPSYGSYGGGGGGGGGGGRMNQQRRDYNDRNDRFNSFGPRKNEIGFHGDMRPNPRVEEELFFKNETQTTGINFDKVR